MEWTNVFGHDQAVDDGAQVVGEAVGRDAVVGALLVAHARGEGDRPARHGGRRGKATQRLHDVSRVRRSGAPQVAVGHLGRLVAVERGHDLPDDLVACHRKARGVPVGIALPERVGRAGQGAVGKARRIE